MIEDEITRTTLRHLQTFGPKSGSRSDEKKKSSFHSLLPLPPSDGLAYLSAAGRCRRRYVERIASKTGTESRRLVGRSKARSVERAETLGHGWHG